VSTPPPTKPAKFRLPFILLVVGLVVVAAAVAGMVYFHPVPDPPAPQWEANAGNLKPVHGGFGWKLGDRLPEELKDEVSNGRYNFHPATNLPPFSQFELDLTDDGRIYQVKAVGYAPGSGADSSATMKNLIALFSRDYGLLHHQASPSSPGLEVYVFGTATSSAHLDIYRDNLFTLEFVDHQLSAVHVNELRTKPR
jgi:hypothetical protein